MEQVPYGAPGEAYTNSVPDQQSLARYTSIDNTPLHSMPSVYHLWSHSL